MINIYIITNKLNNKSYIGQTKHSLSNRIARHKINNTPIGADINKYGDNNFNIAILHKATTQEEADELESKYIIEYDCMMPNGYNTFKGGMYNKKEVINLNTKVVYSSISEASRETGTQTRSIVRVCKGELKSANNCIWMYYEDYLKVKDTLDVVEVPKKTVTVINLDTMFIYPSISEASRATGIAKGSIGLCCRGITQAAGGHRWMYYKDYEKVKDNIVLKPYKKKGTSDRKVVCVETGKSYGNMIQASEDTGASAKGISAVCRGREKSAGGYRWMYEDDYLKLTTETKLSLMNNSKITDRRVINLSKGIIYDSCIEASRKEGISATSISKCCRGIQKTANGDVWRFYKDYLKLSKSDIDTLKGVKVTKRGTAKKVLNVTTNIVYDSVREASKSTGVSFANIGQCCRNKTKTAGGYKWVYIN